MYRLAGCPTENEETGWDEDAGGECEMEERFRRRWTLAHHLGFNHKIEYGSVGDVCDDGTDHETDEGKTRNAEVEVVDIDEDEWEGFEPEVEDGVCDWKG